VIDNLSRNLGEKNYQSVVRNNPDEREKYARTTGLIRCKPFLHKINFLFPLKAAKIFDCLRNCVTSLILTKELCCMELHLEN